MAIQRDFKQMKIHFISILKSDFDLKVSLCGRSLDSGYSLWRESSMQPFDCKVCKKAFDIEAKMVNKLLKQYGDKND
jgi:hypothetical protein